MSERFVQTYFIKKLTELIDIFIYIYAHKFTYPDLFRHLSENINKNEKLIAVIVSCWVKPLFFNGEARIYSI